MLRYLVMIEASNWGIALLAVYLLSFIVPIGIGIYLVINFFSAPKRSRKIQYTADPKTFFAVVIPARNEERVIGHTIQSLRTLQYPPQMVEIIVIADNCMDHTEMLAKREGVKVYVRHDLSRRSKAHAMKWLFEQESFLAKKYDAICILDADAYLAPDFLNAMDAEIQNGYEIVQGRGGSINPFDSMTSGFMTVLASIQNRLWYLPQANRNRSGFYIGTGVCITLERIEKTGWNIETLVEDAEFSIQTVLKGGFVRYCDHARYYVEQVTTWGELWKQQRRWRTGQIDCLKRYLRPISFSVFKKRNKNAISLLILVLIPVLCILSIFQTIATPVLVGAFFGFESLQPLMIAAGLVINLVVMFLFYAFILWLDGTFSIKLWKGMLAVIFSPCFYGLVDIVSLIRPMKEWSPILHGQSKWFSSKNSRLHIGTAGHLLMLEKKNRVRIHKQGMLSKRNGKPTPERQENR